MDRHRLTIRMLQTIRAEKGDLTLAAGDAVTVIIKSTEVMIGKAD